MMSSNTENQRGKTESTQILTFKQIKQISLCHKYLCQKCQKQKCPFLCRHSARLCKRLDLFWRTSQNTNRFLSVSSCISTLRGWYSLYLPEAEEESRIQTWRWAQSQEQPHHPPCTSGKPCLFLRWPPTSTGKNRFTSTAEIRWEAGES